MMKGKKSLRYAVILFLTILCGFCFLVFLPLSVQAYDFQTCDNCHGASLYGVEARFYIHSPFALRQCGECHAAKAAAAPAVVKTPPKISWLGNSAMMDTSHAFLLPGDKLGETIVVDVQGADGKFSRREIAVPLLADLAVMGDSHKPPVISGVQVLKVQRGVFLSATIGWQTDSLAFAQVRYGDKELSQTSEQGKRLGRRHEVVLYELQLDRTYRFAAVSSDFFGLRQVSETFEFSTVNPYEAPLPPATSGNPLEGGTEARLDSGFQRVGADYLLELTLEQPAAVYVGSKGEARQQNVSAESTAGALAADDKIHTGLSSQMVISLDACRTCHTDQSRATHPVNVYPKPAMAIPPEYPTLSDGRITCNSCHVPHGSDYEYLSRKARKRELCIGCHKDIL